MKYTCDCEIEYFLNAKKILSDNIQMVKLEDYTAVELKKMIKSFNGIVKFGAYSKLKKAGLINMMKTHPKIKIQEGSNAVKISVVAEQETPLVVKEKKETKKSRLKKLKEQADKIEITEEEEEEPVKKKEKEVKADKMDMPKTKIKLPSDDKETFNTITDTIKKVLKINVDDMQLKNKKLSFNDFTSELEKSNKKKLIPLPMNEIRFKYAYDQYINDKTKEKIISSKKEVKKEKKEKKEPNTNFNNDRDSLDNKTLEILQKQDANFFAHSRAPVYGSKAYENPSKEFLKARKEYAIIAKEYRKSYFDLEKKYNRRPDKSWNSNYDDGESTRRFRTLFNKAKKKEKTNTPVDEIKQHLREFDNNYLMDLLEKNRHGDPDMYSNKDAEDDLKKDMKKEGINILADYLDPDEIDMIKKDFGKKKDFWKYYSSMLNINKKKEKK